MRADASGDIAAHMSTKSALKQMVIRCKKVDTPTTPDDIATFEIPEQLKFVEGFTAQMSTEKERLPFLLADSGKSKDRILIFGTDQFIRLLASSKDWHIDGTFKIAPPIFSQLVIVQARFRDTKNTLPCLYILMPSKKQIDYMRMFEMVCFSFIFIYCFSLF
jgi:hypothetical protein